MDRLEIAKEWKILEILSHPLENGCWVEVIAEIRNNETGTVNKYIANEIFSYGEPYPNTFNWAENNFSCDCNRHLFFHRAIGEESEDLPECTEGDYSVRLINPINGQSYYDEMPFSTLNK